MGTVSVTRAARLLGVHPNTVRAWTDQGRLPCLRINPRGDRRYRVADLEAFLEPTEAPPRFRSRILQRTATITADRRTAELEVLAEAARLTARPSDLDATLGSVIRLLRRAFGYRMVAVCAVEGEQLICRAAAGMARRRLPPIPLGDGLAGAAIRERRPIFSTDVRADPRYVELLPEVRSEIVVPILAGEGPWGVLLASDDRPGTLQEMDVELLTTVSHQLAAAADRSRLTARLRRQLEQADALRRIGADISSKLELSLILDELVEQAMALFGADRAAVLLRQRDGTYEAPVVRGLSKSYLDFVRVFPRPSLSADALAAGRARFAVDYANHPRGAGVRQATLEEGFDTVAAAPLIAGAEVLGLLVLYHDLRHPWDRPGLDTLEALAGQASLAISNAASYAQTATWAAQLQSIQQLGTRLNRLSTVQEVGRAICAELNQLIDYHNVRVYRVDGEDVLPVAWRGEIGEYTDEVEDQLKLKVGFGITGWVAAYGQAQYLPDARHDPRAATIPGTTDDIEESMLLAPMRYDDRVLGVIVLSKLGLHQFTPADLRLLEIYASLAAQAVSNADATERLQAQSAALERRILSQGELLRITESLLTQLDPRVVLDEIVERLAAIVTYDNLLINVHDLTNHLMRPLVARGVHAELYEAATIGDDEALTGWVVQHGEATLVPDEMADPRVRNFPELGPQAGSLMAVPLRGRDNISGVLILERLGEGRVFSGEEFELVQLFAAQASIAMQNAEAYHHVEVRARTDGLTGLSNHTTFREALARAVAHGQRFSLIMLDLDDFKSYNDTFGHPAGDDLLQALAAALRGSIRDADSVYRYGGDEFALLLPGTDIDGARHVADKVRRAVHAVRVGTGARADQRITCSIGLATFPADGAAAAELLNAADRAAYASKRSGRDRISTAADASSLPEPYVPEAPTPVDPPGEAVATIA